MFYLMVKTRKRRLDVLDDHIHRIKYGIFVGQGFQMSSKKPRKLNRGHMGSQAGIFLNIQLSPCAHTWSWPGSDPVPGYVGHIASPGENCNGHGLKTGAF